MKAQNIEAICDVGDGYPAEASSNTLVPSAGAHLIRLGSSLFYELVLLLSLSKCC